jgi:hypothetical protein
MVSSSLPGFNRPAATPRRSYKRDSPVIAARQHPEPKNSAIPLILLFSGFALFLRILAILQGSDPGSRLGGPLADKLRKALVFA